MSDALILRASSTAPAIIQAAGTRATRRYLEFFTAQIRNTNTRQAYHRACSAFLETMTEQFEIELIDIEPIHVAAHIERLGQTRSRPTVKQHLAAIKGLFDYLVLGQVISTNPAASVHGPKHSPTEGKAPVLDADQARILFESIPRHRPIDLRDRAILSTMLFSFARVSAVTNMKVRDYMRNGSRVFLRLLEKGGKSRMIPAHHLLQEEIEAYLGAAGIAGEEKGALFRSAGPGRSRGGELSDRPISRRSVLAMVKRRAVAAGFSKELCNHSFRGTGITLYLDNMGSYDTAAWLAGHASTKTTKLYDRRKRAVAQTEIERIRF